MMTKKIVIGIRPAGKMFRISSVWGLIADKLLSERGSNKLYSNNFFDRVKHPKSIGEGFGLSNKELGHHLVIQETDILFFKDTLWNDKSLSTSKVFEEFNYLWKLINPILKVDEIRRIGVISEHRMYPTKQRPSEFIQERITKTTTNNFLKNTLLHYEESRLIDGGSKPDLDKDDCINVIKDIYDSGRDEVSDNKAVNYNIDVQRYFGPPVDDLKKGLKITETIFREEKKKFKNELIALEVLDNGQKK